MTKIDMKSLVDFGILISDDIFPFSEQKFRFLCDAIAPAHLEFDGNEIILSFNSV